METTHSAPEDKAASPRLLARHNARAVAADLALNSGIDASAFYLMSDTFSKGSMLAKIPSTPLDAGLEKSALKRAIDVLFEEQLAAWNTSKGWIYSREPRNPDTKRLLSGEVRMTEKALREYGSDLYKVYFVANDFEDQDRPRRQIKTLPEWRSALISQVAPAAWVAPALKSKASRRVR